MKIMSKRPRPTTGSFGRRLAELRKLDRRQRKYLSAKLLLKISPILPSPIVKKMKRRMAKYSPFPLAAPQGLRRPYRSPRIRQIEADLKRAAGRVTN
ncbi:hypothetical protein AB7M35_000018 [Amorphus suaedae]